MHGALTKGNLKWDKGIAKWDLQHFCLINFISDSGVKSTMKIEIQANIFDCSPCLELNFFFNYQPFFIMNRPVISPYLETNCLPRAFNHLQLLFTLLLELFASENEL